MTKIIQFSNEFDGLYSRKNTPWTGGRTVPHKQWDILPGGNLGRERVLQGIKKATWKQGRMG